MSSGRKLAAAPNARIENGARKTFTAGSETRINVKADAEPPLNLSSKLIQGSVGGKGYCFRRARSRATMRTDSSGPTQLLPARRQPAFGMRFVIAAVPSCSNKINCHVLPRAKRGESRNPLTLSDRGASQ
jgi:hypothetical protein